MSPSSRESAAVQDAKSVVRAFHVALDAAAPDEIQAVLGEYTATDWLWRGMHPFYEQTGAAAVADVFWKPIRAAFSPLQRRADIFFAGHNVASDESVRGQANAARAELAEPGETERVAGARDEPRGDESVRGQANAARAELAEPGNAVWVVEMGHLLGLFDAAWLDIPPTNRMCFLRYVEFNRVTEQGVIAESSMFIDIPAVMRQAGHNPFPPQTGSSHLTPGPRTHDGLQFDNADPAEGETTMALVNLMIGDLSEANRVANETGVNHIPVDVMAKTWAADMIWSGPEGIGGSYTIERYQQQHSYPFRFNLADKVFNGHVARFAEGNYACFFGWSNLTNRATGGFLGMPASNAADMRVVDVYRRDGDRLAENWVIIDLLHWLSMQGLDVLARMRQLTGQEKFGE